MPGSDLDHAFERAVAVLRERPAALASDFDGTLSPITYPPEAATLLSGVDAALRRLSSCVLVAIVSGRPVAELVQRVAVQDAVFVGNHGAERWHSGQALLPAPTGAERVAIETAHDLLRDAFAGVPGVRLEPKSLGLAVHYREHPAPEEARQRILSLAPRLAPLGLEPREGKKVVELRFGHTGTKGTSVEWLAAEFHLSGIVFIGDDTTDVDAFRAVSTMRRRDAIAALSIAVLGPETPPAVIEAADLAIDGPEDVAELIRRLAEHPAVVDSSSPPSGNESTSRTG